MDWVEELANNWKKEYPQLDVSSLPPLVRLARLGDLIDGIQNDVLDPFELTPNDYGVLAALQRAGRPYALSPSQLRSQLRRSSGGMTKILKRLEETGLVERKSDFEDGRKVRVVLTPRGLSLHERVFRAFAAASHRLLAKLSSEQKMEIDRALKLLHGQLENLDDGVDAINS